MSSKKHERFAELEGLRGAAAIAVALYHNILAFYPVIFLGFYSVFPVTQHVWFEDNLHGSPFSALLSGTFAVAIFFVLSGFVLSIGYFSTNNLDIIRKLAAKRYLRLVFPALASIMIAYIFIKTGLSLTGQGAAITGSGWLGISWNFDPSFRGALYQGVYRIFFIAGGNLYNNPLWTMSYEFAGSFMVFGFLALFGSSKNRGVLYAVVFFATFNTWYMCFIVGMILADLYAHKRISQAYRSWKVIPVILGGLFLGGYPLVGAKSTIYQYITPSIVQQIFAKTIIINWTVIYLTIGATIIVASVLMTSQIAGIFRKKFMSRLGKYTFSIYLVHVPILYTFTMLAFLVLKQKLGLSYNVAAPLAVIMSIPYVGIAAFFFEKYVDSKSISFSSRIASFALGYEEIPKRLKNTFHAPRKLKLNLLRKPNVEKPISGELVE